MTIHVIDDQELDARMNRVFFKTLEICENEKFTAKDLLWLCFLLENEVRYFIEDEGEK